MLRYQQVYLSHASLQIKEPHECLVAKREIPERPREQTAMNHNDILLEIQTFSLDLPVTLLSHLITLTKSGGRLLFMLLLIISTYTGIVTMTIRKIVPAETLPAAHAISSPFESLKQNSLERDRVAHSHPMTSNMTSMLYLRPW